MSVELGLRLLASGAVRRADVEAALLAHVGRQVPFVRALLDARAIDEATLEQELSRADVPFVRTVSPVAGVVDELPAGFCRRLLAVPVRRDPRTGTVDVAAVDPFDPHLVAEFSHHVGTGVRLVRAPLAAIEEALRRIERGEHATVSFRRPTPPYSSAFRESEPPIPLVRRVPTLAPPAPLGPSDIVEQTESDGTVTDELGEPILPLRTSKPPRSLEHSAPRSGFRPERPTAPGPFSPFAPAAAFPDVAPIVELIRTARSRDEILELLLAGMRPVARRIAIFAAKRAEFQGFACNVEFGDVTALRGVRIAADAPSVLATAVATGAYLGRIPITASHAELLGVMGHATDDVAVVPVKVKGRAALVVVADELEDTMLATRRADELGRAAGESLARLLQQGGGR